MRYFESVHENVRLFEGVYVSACRTLPYVIDFVLEGIERPKKQLLNICLNSLLTEENQFEGSRNVGQYVLVLITVF
jgi:hypothetical protein